MKIFTEKNILYFLLIIFTGLNVALLSKSSARAPEKSLLSPKEEVVFESTSYDFDTLRKGNIAIANFCLQNNTKRPVYISKILSGCGCTAVQWNKQPIQPDERRIIKLQYDTRLLGPFYKWANVSIKGIKDPVLLVIRGVVVSRD